MNRETIFAIVFGILLGVGIGFFVLFQTNNGEQAKVIPVTQESVKKQVAKAAAPAQQSLLQISAPTNNTVVATKQITIKGKAPKNSLIIIQSPSGRDAFKIDKEDFSRTYSLALGENVINISAYSTSSSPQESTLQVYYLAE